MVDNDDHEAKCCSKSTLPHIIPQLPTTRRPEDADHYKLRVTAQGQYNLRRGLGN